MTTLSTFWSRIRPWVWPSSEDLNPKPVFHQLTRSDMLEVEVESIRGRVEGLENKSLVDWTKIDAYYIQVASQSFMEHMNRVQTELQKAADHTTDGLIVAIERHRLEVGESIESLNRRLAEAETLAGAEIAKLQAECQLTSERVAMLLRRLKSLGDE